MKDSIIFGLALKKKFFRIYKLIENITRENKKISIKFSRELVFMNNI